MNRDVRIATNYPNHPKTRKLIKLLGTEGVMCHIFLLCFVAQTTPSGVLKDMQPEDIEDVSGWKGDANAFVGALLEVGFLTRTGKWFAIKNWPKHNYFAMTAEARSQIARRNANKRWEKKRKVKQEDNANGISNSHKRKSYSPPPPPSLEGEGELGPPHEEVGAGSPAEKKPTVEGLLKFQKAIEELPGDSPLKASFQSAFERQVQDLSEADQERLAIRLTG